MIRNILKKYRIYGPKKFLRYLILELFRVFYWTKIRKSYSQRREDLIIDRLLGYKKKGFYVDVGAYDPNRFSNTKRFYDRGWRGINIEPSKNNYLKFKKHREDDINLNIGVASEEGKLTFFSIIPDTLSTFSVEEAKRYQEQGFELDSKKHIEVECLEGILDKYAENKQIDFMSIDTEGYDMEILKSNNWSKYRPKIICIESASYDQNDKDSGLKGKEHELFLESVGYEKIYNSGLNCIYRDKNL